MPVTRPPAPANSTRQHRRVMGSDAHIVVIADGGEAAADRLLAAAWARLDDLEGRWSRFRPDSEVSALNRDAGGPVAVSTDTLLLVSRAIAAWELTEGRFDPTVGAALIALGYDREFADVARSGAAASAGAAPRPAPGPEGIDVDRRRGTITLPGGVSFDPGGIGKGLSADLVGEMLLDAGALGALVNLGGDLRAVGEAPGGDGWPVGLPDPLRPGHELARFTLPHGAVATSSRLRRWWPTSAGPVHHLVDPATGLSATTATVAVSVVADRAWRAEALAKALFLGGPDEIDRHPDTHAIVVTADGRRHASPALEATLR